MGLYAWARAQHERKDGEEESFSSSKLSLLNHSNQSSLETLLAAPQACSTKQDNSTTKRSTIQKQKKSISRQHCFFTAPNHIVEIPFSIPWNPLPLPDNLQYFSLISKKSSLNVFLSWHAKYLTWITLPLEKYIKSWSHCWNISSKILNAFRITFLSPAFSNQSIPLLNWVLHAFTVQIGQCLAIMFYTGFKRV